MKKFNEKQSTRVRAQERKQLAPLTWVRARFMKNSRLGGLVEASRESDDNKRVKLKSFASYNFAAYART